MNLNSIREVRDYVYVENPSSIYDNSFWDYTKPEVVREMFDKACEFNVSSITQETIKDQIYEIMGYNKWMRQIKIIGLCIFAVFSSTLVFELF